MVSITNKLSYLVLHCEVFEKLIWKPNSNDEYFVKSMCDMLSTSTQSNVCNFFSGK